MIGSLADLVAEHLERPLRSGAVRLRELVAATPGISTVELRSPGLRVLLTLDAGVIDGLAYPTLLESAQPIDLAAALGVFAEEPPAGNEPLTYLTRLGEHHRDVEEAAQSRESWFLLAERAEEVGAGS